MKPVVLPVLLLAVNSLASLTAVATDYYIDSVTGDDSRSGAAPTEAWKTIDKINALNLKPGDTVNLKAGSSFTAVDYQTVLHFGPEDSGTPEKPVIVRSYGEGAKPLLYQTYSDTRNSAVVGFRGEVSNIIVDGLHLKGILGTPSPVCGRDGIDVVSTALVMDNALHSNLTIRNCEIEGGMRGLLLYRCKNVTVTNNWIHDIHGANTRTRDWAPLWPEQHHGKKDPGFPLDPIAKPNGADDDSGAEAIDINSYTEDIEISHNTVQNVWYDSFDYGQDGTFIEVYDGNHTNVQVFGNTITNCPGGTIEMGAWKGGVVSNFDFHHNLITEATNLFVIHCHGMFSLTDIKGIRFNNNTLVQREIKDDSNRPWTIFDVNGVVKDPAKIQVQNNIFYLKTGTRNLWNGSPASNTSSISGSDDAFTRTNNLYFHAPGAQGRFLFAQPLDKTEMVGKNPGFADMAKGDYTLSAGSPAVKAGANLGYTQDLLGKPIIGTPDLGAYQRQDSTVTAGK